MGELCPLCKTYPKADLCLACVYDTEAGEEIHKLETTLTRAQQVVEAAENYANKYPLVGEAGRMLMEAFTTYHAREGR